ncbi:MAG: efflux RND transporter periplasmic adaptor subunit [Cyanobacteria bacterium P01_A01_bin.135]
MTPTDSRIQTVQDPTPVNQQRSTGRPWLWGLLLLALLGGGGFLLWRLLGARGGPPQMGPMEVLVELQDLQLDTVATSSELIGVLDAEQGVTLRPEADGRVARLFVESGQVVQQGDPVVLLSPERNQAEVSAAQANESVSQAALNTARSEVSALRAEKVELEAELDLQNTEFSRTEDLVTDGALAQQDLDRVERDRRTAQASLNAINERITAAEQSVRQAEASLSQARAQTGAVQADLNDKQVRAPIAGVVGDVPVKLGDYLDTGDVITTITQNENLEIDLDIPIEFRDRLREGLPVEIVVGPNSDAIATGNISFVSPQVNAATQSVLATASFDNVVGLQDDQRVIARVIWSEQPGVLVPTAAVSRLGGQTFVFVAQEETTEDGETQMVAEQRQVTLGDIQGNSYHVTEGVEAGETIVTSGILNLSDGAPITTEPPQPPPGGPPAG